MKKIIVTLLTILLLMNSLVISNAATQKLPITIYFNDNYVSTPVMPFAENGTTFVPLRVFIDALGIANVEWLKDEGSVSLQYGKKSIKFFVNQSKVLVNGNEYTLDAVPTLVDGSAMVPLNFIADNLACEVTWDNLTNSLFIKKEGITLNAKSKAGYTPEDVLWLARIIQVEGSGTSYACKLAIANVVLNRVKSGVFPDTIHDVIYQHGQFPPARKAGFSDMVPREANILVAKNALNGENNVGKCLYFNNNPFRSKADDLYTTIDGEYFYN